MPTVCFSDCLGHNGIKTLSMYSSADMLMALEADSFSILVDLVIYCVLIYISVSRILISGILSFERNLRLLLNS